MSGGEQRTMIPPSLPSLSYTTLNVSMHSTLRLIIQNQVDRPEIWTDWKSYKLFMNNRKLQA